MNKFLLIFCIPLVSYAQDTTDYSGGQFSLGTRTTFSSFNSGDNERSALGLGGQFRIRLNKHINTEWFLDYLPASNSQTRREDYHIGWSVMYYPFDPEKRFVPYLLAGHCFDYTNQYELLDRSNQIDRWSSAAQAGLGIHYNLTDQLDLSFSTQYMIHLGTDVHHHIENGEVHFEQHKGGSLEGHLLSTVSLNYKIGDMWSRSQANKTARRNAIHHPESRFGLLQGTATIYPAWMLNHPVQNNYVGGHLTYYLEDNFSFRGDVLTYIDAQSATKYLKSHSQLTAGFGKHWPVGKLDPYMYLQMGLSTVRLQTTATSVLQPVMGSTMGLSYHVAPWFYFFAEGIYAHMQDPGGPGNLDQLYLSGGLGFQIQTLKH